MNLISSVTFVVILNFISRIIAFGRDIFVAAKYGISLESDLIFSLLNAVYLFSFILGSGISPIIISIYKNSPQKKANSKVFQFSIYYSFIVLSIFFIASSALPEYKNFIISKYLDKFASENPALVVTLLFLSITASISAAALVNFEKHALANAGMLVNGVFTMAYIMFSGLHPNMNNLALSLIASYVVQIFFQVKVLWKKQDQFELFRLIDLVYMKKALYFSLFAIVNYIYIVYDYAVAADYGEGILSIVNYGIKISQVPYALLFAPIFGVIYVKITDSVSSKKQLNLSEEIEIFSREVILVSVAVLCAAVYFVDLFANYLIIYKKLNKESLNIFKNLVVAYLLGSPLFILSSGLNGYYIAMGLIKKLIIIMIIGFISKLLLVNMFGYLNNAVTLPLSSVFGMLVVGFLYNRKRMINILKNKSILYAIIQLAIVLAYIETLQGEMKWVDILLPFLLLANFIRRFLKFKKKLTALYA